MNLLPAPVSDSLASYPPRAGNDLRPWVDGIPFYTRLYEAFSQARSRIWFVVSFLHRDFRFPGGPLLWDALDQCAARGVEICVLCWRNAAFFMPQNLFQGDAADLAFLAARRAPWRLRWDSSFPDAGHSHHQKLWLIDAQTPQEVGFVGGMTWGNTTLDRPAHDQQLHSRHDICVELRGPCVTDVAHNFVQRWNQARQEPGGPPHWPSKAECPALEYPQTLAVSQAGPYVAQVTRTLQAGRYRTERLSPGAGEFETWQGESSILAGYLAAIHAAQRSIYLENQHPGEKRILEALEAALARGVEVLLIVPGEPMRAIARERASVRSYLDGGRQGPEPRYLGEFEALSRVAASPRFRLGALAKAGRPGPPYAEIYTHAKLCVVDGSWLTCGSANLVDLSLHADHSELNISGWAEAVARPLLRDLLHEHTGAVFDATEDDERVWLRSAWEMAEANRTKRQAGLPQEGHLYALDAATYPELPGEDSGAR